MSIVGGELFADFVAGDLRAEGMGSHPFRLALSNLYTILLAAVVVTAATWLRAGQRIESRWAALLMGTVIGVSYRVSFVETQPVGLHEIYVLIALAGGGFAGTTAATVLTNSRSLRRELG